MVLGIWSWAKEVSGVPNANAQGTGKDAASVLVARAGKVATSVLVARFEVGNIARFGEVGNICISRKIRSWEHLYLVARFEVGNIRIGRKIWRSWEHLY